MLSSIHPRPSDVPAGHLPGALLVAPSTAQGLLLAWNRKHAARLVACSGRNGWPSLSLHVLPRARLVLAECQAGYHGQPGATPLLIQFHCMQIGTYLRLHHRVVICCVYCPGQWGVLQALGSSMLVDAFRAHSFMRLQMA